MALKREMKKVKLTRLVESLEEQSHSISTTTPSHTSTPFPPLTPNPNTFLSTQAGSGSNQREHECNNEVEQEGIQTHITSAHESSNAKTNKKKKKKLELRGLGFINSSVAANAISDIVKGHYSQPWPSWKKIPEVTRQLCWEKFESKYEFIPPDHVHAQNNFEKREKLNRASDCGEFGVSLHAGGSIISSQHTVNLTNSLGRLPTPIEIFERTHKHKDKTWVDKKSKHFNAEFNHAKEEATQKAYEDGSSAPDEIDLWCEIAGVRKGKIYGLGIESTTIDKRFNCCNSNSQWLQRSEHEELVKKLEEENSYLKTRLKKTEKTIEENNKLVQQMMKMMNFQVPTPQVEGDGGKASTEE
ncbi:hypothetical protein PIB30_071491 [Stylosanthes scabra]|uniref:Transposase n=1 Tax=Stylosanthes scabra TaxID=79078 RepID=A0ABU6ZMI7_9FABA|nr:hypothetical protein [Stylosanthes scabra]